MNETILIAGASGQLGRRVVELLHEDGYKNLIAASRNPEKLDHFAAQGIEIRQADFNEPEKLKEAFKGVDRLLLISTDQLHPKGLRITQHSNAILAAKAAGVNHIVYTSMPNPAASVAIPFAPDHVATERELLNSGIAFTSLRVAWYADNLLGFLPQIIAAGKWPTVAGSGRIPYISREDVAEATVAFLRGAKDSSYEDISGAKAMSIAEIAAIAAEVFERPIQVEEVADTVITEKLVEIGIPEGFAPIVVMTDLNMRAGIFNIENSTVKEAIGRDPHSLKDFLIEKKQAFLGHHS